MFMDEVENISRQSTELGGRDRRSEAWRPKADQLRGPLFSVDAERS